MSFFVDEEFEIKNGSTTQENIDDVYCLSFVMPNCCIHLSTLEPGVKREKESEGVPVDDLYVREEPRGTYHHLRTDQPYYVYVEQEADQLKRDQEKMKNVAAQMEGASVEGSSGIERDDGRGMESCSCIYGNPCVDEYGCKDWDNRMTIALKNGWKGF
jgi:hypothetical protein